MFETGNIKIEELNDGTVFCGVCMKSWKRIIGHLKNNANCSMNIDLKELNNEWSKFKARQRRAKCNEKQQAINHEQFLKIMQQDGRNVTRIKRQTN